MPDPVQPHTTAPTAAPIPEAGVGPVTALEPAPDLAPDLAPDRAPDVASDLVPDVASDPAPDLAPEPAAADAAPGSGPATRPERTADLSPAACAARLAELFLALFGTEGPRKPIKLRIQVDLQARAPGVFSKRALSLFLSRYTTTTGYLKALAQSPHRFDLDGQAAGEISEEHRQAASEEAARRREVFEARRLAERQAQREAERAAFRAQREAQQQPQQPAQQPLPGNTAIGLPHDATGGVSGEGPQGQGEATGEAPREALRRARGQAQATENTPPHAAGPVPGLAKGAAAERARRPAREQSPRGDPRGDPRGTRPGPPRPLQGAPRREPTHESVHRSGHQSAHPPAYPPTQAPARNATPEPPREAVIEDPAQRERAALLRAFESSTLSKANFCVLKRLTEAALDEAVAQARVERGLRPHTPAQRPGSSAPPDRRETRQETRRKPGREPNR